MYSIVYKSTSIKKDFENLLDSLSEDIQKRVLNRLTYYPFPNRQNATSYGGIELHGRIEKKGKIYCYEITGADRILFDIIKKTKTVFITYSGGHGGELIRLRGK